MNINTNFFQVYRITRASDWRLSFVPFVIGCIYLWFIWLDVEFNSSALIIFFASLVTTFGFAAFGYYINEYYDQEIDLKAGKINKLAYLPAKYKFLILFIILIASSVPWIWLPYNKIILGLVSFEVSLFFLYSHPFFRFKEVPIVSNIIDSMYAYLVPLLLTYYIYTIYAGQNVDSWIILLAIAVFYIGFRNILIHQVNDIFKDKKSALTTLPSLLGVYNTNILLAILLMLEVFVISIFFIGVSSINVYLSCWVVFYLFFVIRELYKNKNSFKSEYFSISKARHITDSAYQIWLPLFMFIPLLISDWKWSILIPLQLTVLTPFRIFKPIISLSKKSYQLMIVFLFVHVRHFISLCVNYPIHIFFLIFGVNLKKENKSAFKYLKDKWS